MNNTFDDYIINGTVKVGERGQNVIPSKAWRDFDLKAGDLRARASRLKPIEASRHD